MTAYVPREAAASLPGITAAARKADCPRCEAGPLEDCWPDLHFERFIRAWRYGLICDADLTAVMEAMIVFTLESTVPAEVLRRAA